MKKISTEIKKSSFIIISIFVIFIFFSLFGACEYFYTLNKQRLQDSMDFLKIEISEIKDTKKFNEIFSGTLVADDFQNEDKFLKNLDIYIEYKNNYYLSTDKIKNLNNLKKEIEDRDVFLNFKDKKIILSDKFLYKNSYVKIILFENIADNLILFKKIIGIFIFLILLATILSLFINKYIVALISKSLNKIMTLNENISLDNLKLIRPKNDFMEFENIYASYEKMLEKLDIQNKQQIDFIHSASHELKTPLFVLNGNLEILEKYILEDMGNLKKSENKNLSKETISFMKKDIKDMNILIEKLLFIASYNNLSLNRENFELSNLILENINNLKKVYEKKEKNKKDIKVKINFDIKFIEINSDYELVKILLKNILENAIKYGNNKEINIFLEETEKEVEIRIKDKGLGMSEEDLKNIFNKFYRTEKAKNQKTIKKSYGLGMYIVKKIIDLLDGEINIKSKENIGTEVLIKLKK